MSEFKAIVTERLILRPVGAQDRARLVALANNWRVAKNLSTMPFPYTEVAADEWISKQPSLWAGGKTVTLAVTLDGLLIGGIGIGVRDSSEWELGYWLGESYWNRGYASEAAIAVRNYAFEVLQLDRIVAGHYADNHASGRILAKLGLRYTCEVQRFSMARGAKVLCLEMAMTREWWLESTQNQGRTAAVA